MQNFRAPLCLRQLGASPPDPHWPPAAGGSAPQTPQTASPIANFWLRAWLLLYVPHYTHMLYYIYNAILRLL